MHDDVAEARSTAEREVIGRLTDAFERGDVTTFVSMLTDDAWLIMPPWPLGFRGPAAAGLLTARPGALLASLAQAASQ